jgi:NADH dehydrogenase
VHVALLTSTRAKVEAFVEWAWDYFGSYHGDAILDRSEELKINWDDDGEETATAASAASSQTDKAP